MKHQIKHRYTNTVLFECDVPDDVQASGMATRYTLEKAVKCLPRRSEQGATHDKAS